MASAPLPRKAVALLSGGLDSMLAIKLILDQGIPVVAVRFITNFGCDPVTSGSCGHDVEPLYKMWGHLGLEIKMSHLGQDYIDLVRNPPHGRGRNMNPCVDCRLMMLRWGRELMDTHGAGFMITGEVVNQRPLSQTKPSLALIERESELDGLLLRPLSAKLLPPTKPEMLGIVDRSKLLDISGRSRIRQYELAKQYGILDIPQPSGGCLLTDPGYSDRLRELWQHNPGAGTYDINLLRVGRHFRFSPAAKIIVGRNKEENDALEAWARPEDALVRVRDFVGPITLVRGAIDDAVLRFAAALTARYADVPDGVSPVAVTAPGQTLMVEPAPDDAGHRMRVGVR
jgi:tRNA U34 2-thiouridine synthase MnmA/TrmU